MCGRYTLALPLGELVEVFEVDAPTMDGWQPRFNIAPTQDAPVVVTGRSGERRMGTMRWGLVPSWADDPAIGNRMINARSESASQKPAFRSAYRSRRCLVLADGFYEWRKPAGGKGPKTPFHILRPDGEAFAMAGLWERWRASDDAEPLHTFTILTREAAGWMRSLHHRMPVILSPQLWDDWLAPETEVPQVETLVGEAPALELVAREVSTRVNRPSNDDVECVRPVEGGETISP